MSSLRFHKSAIWYVCPAVLGWAFLCFVGIISTVSRQLRYSPSRACVCLPPGFLTLWLYLPSCRFAHGYCRGLALCMFVILLRFPLGCCRGLALCVLIICVCFARSQPGLLGFARSPRGFALCLAQHHIERHHEAKAHHKCYGGAVWVTSFWHFRHEFFYDYIYHGSGGEA